MHSSSSASLFRCLVCRSSTIGIYCLLLAYCIRVSTNTGEYLEKLEKNEKSLREKWKILKQQNGSLIFLANKSRNDTEAIKAEK